MKVSIIIPVLNEEDTIKQSLLTLQQYRSQGHEIVVVDGGSNDDTVARTHDLVDKILKSKSGRSYQMNAGAEYSHGDILLFLHADTLLPEDACLLVSNALSHGKEWGRFNVRLSGKAILFRVIERMMNWRSCLTSIATGDQAIFVLKSSFTSVGGFPGIRLMEDIVLSRRLRNRSKPVCLKEHVVTSSRKWEEEGVLKTILLMWRLRFMYFMGVSADRLVKQYYKN